MPKFFIDNEIAEGDRTIRVTGDDRRHMKDVLRIKPGEAVSISDPSGRDYACRLLSYDDSGACLEITECLDGDREPDYEVTVYQGLPKSDKMDSIIQKCTELGACRIIPVVCARSVAKFRDIGDAQKKTGRWAKIAREAAKQSGRSRIPQVGGPVAFTDALAGIGSADIRFIPWECEDSLNLKQFLISASGDTPAGIRTIAFIIGPEGGFDASEVELARRAGISPVTLGKRILRTETAAPTVLAMLQYEFEFEL
ncbi:MAG: RsmE family RNA methyltransferase [Saccharofermentanales bacterium]